MVRRIVPPDLQLILSGEPIVAVPLKDVASPLPRHPQMRVPFQVKDEPQRLPIELDGETLLRMYSPNCSSFSNSLVLQPHLVILRSAGSEAAEATKNLVFST